MDNQTIDIVSEGDAGGKATHYKVINLRRETKYYATRNTKLEENWSWVAKCWWAG